MPRRRWVVFDLLSNVPDVYPQSLRVLAMMRPPDLLQDHVGRHNPVEVSYEESNDVEFRSRQANLIITTLNAPSGEVDRKLSDRKCLGLGHRGPHPTHKRSQSRQKLG